MEKASGAEQTAGITAPTCSLRITAPARTAYSSPEVAGDSRATISATQATPSVLDRSAALASTAATPSPGSSAATTCVRPSSPPAKGFHAVSTSSCCTSLVTTTIRAPRPLPGIAMSA